MRTRAVIIAGTVSAMTLLSGCAINQKVTPVSTNLEKKICIIDNPAVKNGFLAEYRAALSMKGYASEVLPQSASITDCQVTSAYTASWRWDLALYMAYAEINIYSGGKLAGNAKYDSLSGGANLGKFINASEKIRELVNQLIPGGSG